MIIENAKITRTYLGGWDDSIPNANGSLFTSFVYVELAGGCIAAGGHSLIGETTDRWVRGVLQAVGVCSWEKLPGQMCRVKLKNSNGPVTAIGHIIKDQWFEYREEL